MTDIEIATQYKKINILDIAKKLSLKEEDLILYGNDKAKIKKKPTQEKGKLILVTAISPTPYGEGKTTVSIGLQDALCKLNKNSLAVLREPSMGPVFGMKGGATGGGYSQVVPMEDINLHFTGDFHAITAANNLLCAAIDNHIFQGNSLDIQKVVFHRALDVNDRALRTININNREESFSITAASEIMALFCLANSYEDLRNRLGNIIIGYNSKGKIIYAKDLKIEGSLMVLLKDAFLPNLVQTLEGNPVIIHGGPFANIAHGCNSVVATKLGLSLSDYVVTEAGFGADLGAEKFYDIKCRSANISPACTVLVATIKALKYHGGITKEDIYKKNNEALIKGLENLQRHVDNLKKFSQNIIVSLNKYETDLEEEINLIKDYCQKKNILFTINDSYKNGSAGSIDLATKVLELINNNNNFKFLYDTNSAIKDKIKCLCQEIYHANNIEYSDIACEKIRFLEKNKLDKLPICVAKTQYSFSDDAKKVGAPSNYTIHIRDINIYNGAKFITVLLGNIVIMPGLPTNPNYEKIDLINNKVIGLN